MKKKTNRTKLENKSVPTASQFVDEAEIGYDVSEILKRRGGRPTLGASPSSVESVRLDPTLKREILLLAADRGLSVSETIRLALRDYVAANGKS